MTRQISLLRWLGNDGTQRASVARRGGARIKKLVFVIAVGTSITGRPPHRSERAQFGHSAPTLGVSDGKARS